MHLIVPDICNQNESLSQASMVKAQCNSEWFNPLLLKVHKHSKMIKPPFLLFVFHNDWLQNHCWLSFKSKKPDFEVILARPYLRIFVEDIVTLLGAMTDKWVWKLVRGRN